MQIEIVSDLHLTFDEDQGTAYLASLIPKDETQVLILAGDMGEFPWWLQARQQLDMVCRLYPHVIFVAGNHDYYGTTLDDGDVRFRDLEEQIENFHVLEQEVMEIDGVKFAGCSLWFREDPLGHLYEPWMSDFSSIDDFKPEVFYRNGESKRFLRQIPSDTDVVITHHLPTYMSVQEEYVDDFCNRFFLCEIDAIILDRAPKVWIHGHTHFSLDYYLGNTRIVCNPRGYPGENRDGPYAPLIVEI